ncbi:MAG TPA: DEAD/DEAH box helicase, partial [Chitinophaga sp.]|uniref:DEAD/DEAH box helicase n=1 Tax=Chitinophaga sp. TaxID=1869181 RepID=UPI002CF57369
MQQQTRGWKVVTDWLADKELQPFRFQEDTWNAYLEGKSGLVNAPTGFGKTFSLFLGVVIDWINKHPKDFRSKSKNGLQLMWITPLRALAKDLGRAMEAALGELQIPWQVGIRSGDTSTSTRAQQKRQMPEILIITPESLHILLAQKEYPAVFRHLQTVVVDEWHELIGSKRGVMTELGISRLKGLAQQAGKPALKIWGISATIGNLDEALQVLLGPYYNNGIIIRANLKKNILLQSVIPHEMENYPWAGHLGIRMLPQALPIIDDSQTTLIFTNTRSQSEIWYQSLLRGQPMLAGALALHHGSIDMELRIWVEEALHNGI